MAYVKCIRNLISSTVPDGKTVTPTDDISIWLACGGRSETYTTLSQVLADSTCLSALINDNNAVDYLVRSTTWASDVCSDSSAMSYIGLNNYASNTLLADSTWCSAIFSSTYRESVLNVKTPTMESANTPSGVVSANSYNASNVPYKAFDKNNNTYWELQNTSSNNESWVDYEFPSNAKFYGFSVLFKSNTTRNRNFGFKIQGSADGNTYKDTFLQINANVGTRTLYEDLFTSNIDSYNHCRLYLENKPLYSGSVYYGEVCELQFYGRADI